MTAPAPVLALETEASGSVVALTSGLRRWSAGAWQPVLTTPARRLLALPDGDLYVAPYFSSTSGLARITANGVVRRTFSGSFGLNLGVTDLTLADDGDILVAGDIQGFDSVASVGVARLDAPCPAASATEGAGCAGSVGPLALTPTVLPWLGATFRAVATGLPTLAFGVAVTGFAPTTLPLLAVFPAALPGCDLHVQPDLLEVALAAGGTTSVQLVVPNSATLVGVVVRHQVVSLQFDSALNFTEVTATNSLRSTLGVL
jgi:hypothetical protein